MRNDHSKPVIITRADLKVGVLPIGESVRLGLLIIGLNLVFTMRTGDIKIGGDRVFYLSQTNPAESRYPSALMLLGD